MVGYRYDGTFEGLLCALAEAFSSGREPADILAGIPEQTGLFEATCRVETDHERAGAFLHAIARKISPFAARTARIAFLSESPGVEMAIYRYLALGRQVGGELDGMLSHGAVLPVHRLARRVSHEAHRLKGFIRFREVEERFWYAAIEPDHRILPLIAPHFAERFRDQHWIIHDLRRSLGIIHDASHHEWAVVELELCHLPQETQNEELYQTLWRRYFTEVAIAGRKNLKVQGNRLPRRYREHLVEFG
jgi:probable DNA metabolism protein